VSSRTLCWVLCFAAFACSENDDGSSGNVGGAAGTGGTCTTCDSGIGGTSTGGTAGTLTGGSGGSAGNVECAIEAKGVAVADVDLDGYPSYVVDECQLLYVSAASGDLVLRDLANGEETTIAPAAETPRRPAFRAGIMAWEATEAAKSVIRVRANASVKTPTGSFDHAGEPRVTSDAVVFTGWAKAEPASDTDVYLYVIATDQVSLAAGGTGQQRFADISSTHIAVSDFSEDPGGVYLGDGISLANVIVVDRSTGTPTVRTAPGKQAFPMLGSEGTLAYLEWLEVHPVPKLQDYSLMVVPLTTLEAPGVELAHVTSDVSVRPTASTGLIEWVVRDEGVNTLWRAPIDDSTAPQQIPLQSAEVLHAPSASSMMTVLAVRATATDSPELVAIPR
jgi:hypothetical protein